MSSIKFTISLFFCFSEIDKLDMLTIECMTKRLLDSFGKRLRVLRLDLGLTQGEVLEQMESAGVKIGQSYISDMERTDKLPNGEVLVGLAKVLHTTTDYLLLLSDDPTPAQESETRLVLDVEDRRERELLQEALELIQDLPPAEQRIAVEAILLIKRASHTGGPTGAR